MHKLTVNIPELKIIPVISVNDSCHEFCPAMLIFILPMKSLYPFFLSMLLFSVSCHKAGTGGDATLIVFPEHHGISETSKSNYPDSVYVFFNTKDLPADPVHHADMIFTGEEGEDHVHCENLHTGDYFLYAAAWDSLHNIRVFGGMAVTIKFKERKQEIDVHVPVSQ
jgi:hypothetical protein